MQQTISQAAHLYGKARSTIHRAIESGRLSCSVRGDGVRVIDLAELIRLWGEPPNQPPQAQQNATPQDDPAQQALIAELRALREEVRGLREEVRELRRLPAPAEPPPAQTAPAPTEPEPATPPQAPATASNPPRDFSALLARFEERTKH
nr:hypothetical protein [uncultured Halomonas sp.]